MSRSTTNPASPPETAHLSKKARDFIALLIILLLAALSNPGKARHDAAVREKVAAQSPVASLFGVGRLTTWVSQYHSLGVVSYTTLDGKLISVGAFGMISVR